MFTLFWGHFHSSWWQKAEKCVENEATSKASSVTNTYGQCRLNDSSAVVHCTSSYRFFYISKKKLILCFKSLQKFPHIFHNLFFSLNFTCERNVLTHTEKYSLLDTYNSDSREFIALWTWIFSMLLAASSPLKHFEAKMSGSQI